MNNFGTTLATITSEKENNIAKYSISALGLSFGDSHWIGYSDGDYEGSFKWTDNGIFGSLSTG